MHGERRGCRRCGGRTPSAGRPRPRPGRTTRSVLVPWLSTYPISTGSPASTASRSAASEPLGVSVSTRAGRPGRRDPVAGPDRRDHLRGLGRSRAAAAAPPPRGSRGVRARQLVGPRDVDGAVGRLDDRRGAELAQPRQQHVERRSTGHEHGRARSGAAAAPPPSGGGAARSAPSRRRRAGTPRRGRPGRCRRCGRCRRPGSAAAAAPSVAATSSRNSWTSSGRPADVEGAAHRAGGEPVDGGPAARLDVGHQLQPPGQPTTRAGRARRRSGRPGSAPGRPAAGSSGASAATAASSSPASSARPRSARPPSPVTPRAADSSTSAQPPGRRGTRGRRGRSHATRATTRRDAGAGWRAPRPAGRSASTSSAIRRDSAAIELDSSGARALRRLAGRVAGADQAGDRGWCAARRAARASHRPRRVARPARRRTRRSAATPGRRAASARAASSPAAAATSTSSAAVRSSTCSSAAAALRSRTAEPADCAARPAARCPSGRAAARPGVPPRTPRRRRPGRPAPESRADVASAGDVVDRLARRATAAQRQRHLARAARRARRRAAPAAAARAAPRRASSRPRAPRVRRADAGRGLAAVGVDVVEHRAGPARSARRAAAATRSAARGGSETRAQAARPRADPRASAVGDAGQRPQPARWTARPAPGRPAAPARRDVAAGVGVPPRRPRRRRWLDPTTTRASRTASSRWRQLVERAGKRGPGGRARRPAGRSPEGPGWRGRDARGAAGRAGRRATRAAGRRGCGVPRRSHSLGHPLNATRPSAPGRRTLGAPGRCDGAGGAALRRPAPTSVGSARSTRTPARRATGLRRSPTAWAATTAVTSRARIVGRGAAPARRRGLRPRARPTRRSSRRSRERQRRIAEYAADRRSEGFRSSPPARPRSRPCWSRPRPGPRGWWPTSATPAATGSPHGSSSR